MTTPELQLTCDCRVRSSELVSRRSFEAWIASPPYERDCYRWPVDAAEYAWPGQYKDIAVQLAWEAWCETANDKLTDGGNKTL